MRRTYAKIIIAIAMLLLSLFPLQYVCATSGYARITRPMTYLYIHATSEIENNVICYLEESYFVEITLDYNSDFYKVNYNGISGYVQKNSVTPIIGTPINPYPTPSMTTIDTKCYLRSSPTTAVDNIVTVVPESCTDLHYIGKLFGEEAIDYQGKLWYYVSYFGVNGYIYSQYVYTIGNIAMNSEVFDATSGNLAKNPTPLSIMECGIIIAILCIPAIAIVILMYRTPKAAKESKKVTRKIPKQKKIDYDELL